jgi:hypothetical protein
MKAKLKSPWISRHAAAALFDRSVRQFDSSIRSLLPPSAIRTEGRTVWVNFRTTVDCYIADQIAKAKPVVTDPLLAGGDSPALEEYRKHRARLAELDVAERENKLIPLAEIEPSLQIFASNIRRAGEQLERVYGHDAAALLNDAIDETLSEWERFLARQKSKEMGGGS